MDGLIPHQITGLLFLLMNSPQSCSLLWNTLSLTPLTSSSLQLWTSVSESRTTPFQRLQPWPLRRIWLSKTSWPWSSKTSGNIPVKNQEMENQWCAVPSLLPCGRLVASYHQPFKVLNSALVTSTDLKSSIRQLHALHNASKQTLTFPTARSWDTIDSRSHIWILWSHTMKWTSHAKLTGQATKEDLKVAETICSHYLQNVTKYWTKFYIESDIWVLRIIW